MHESAKLKERDLQYFELLPLYPFRREETGRDRFFLSISLQLYLSHRWFFQSGWID